MTKHTPGPWRSDYDDNGFYCVLADEMPSPYIVATGGEGDVDKANATLSAAAPDLLEALKGVIRVADRKTDIFDAAHAAVAKAEGRTDG